MIIVIIVRCGAISTSGYKVPTQLQIRLLDGPVEPMPGTCDLTHNSQSRPKYHLVKCTVTNGSAQIPKYFFHCSATSKDLVLIAI